MPELSTKVTGMHNLNPHYVEVLNLNAVCSSPCINFFYDEPFLLRKLMNVIWFSCDGVVLLDWYKPYKFHWKPFSIEN